MKFLLKIVSEDRRVPPKERTIELLQRSQKLLEEGWEIKGFGIDYGIFYILLQKETTIE